MSRHYSYSSDEDSRKARKISERHSKKRYERLKHQELGMKSGKRKEKEEDETQKRLLQLAKETAKEPGTSAASSIWDEEYLGYTNSDNPFGDANLLKTFVWSKKYEKLGIKDIDPEEIERQNRIRLEENKRELEKVKQRRLEREREKEARLEELSRFQREKEALQFKEWEKQEDTFHLKQAKLRSQLRIKEGRAKPIDLLARYIDVFGVKEENQDSQNQDSAFELAEPYLFLNGLRISDMEDLQEDIKVYMELDDKGNMDYWKDLQIIVDDELIKLRKFSAAKQLGLERRESINAAVTNEVVAIFKGKTPSQLAALQTQIEKKINSGEEGIDISYWESLLSQLKAHMARARLRERHQENMKKSLEKLKVEQGVVSETSVQNDPQQSTTEPPELKQTISEEAGPSSVPDTKAEESENELLQKCIEEYENGGYSPMLIPTSQLEAGTVVVAPAEDWEQLMEQRQQVVALFHKKAPKKRPMTEAEMAFEREARKGMTEEESVFTAEETIKQDKSVASWSDKYRPRKPRYFNRVHTGFEWNKYNQTHYDVDNPPPKIVQGYKFNIFYPDLIDKHRTPTYTVTPCEDNRDFAVIRFSAGPPYEDIAFKIVNREWNYSYKSGFRCQFHNNILQLWFHFKRYRYRR